MFFDVTKIELFKKITSLHQKGFNAMEVFSWMIDDCLAGFGRPLPAMPPKELHSHLFELGQLYAQEVIDRPPFTDILGLVYMEIVSHWQKKGSGQYFTPFEVAKLMSQMVNEPLPDKEVIRICEPTCGSGVMLLAILSNHIKQPDVLKRLSLTMIDLDLVCSRMAPLQILANQLIYQFPLGELLAQQGNSLGDLKELNVIYWSQSPPVKEYYNRVSRDEIELPASPDIVVPSSEGRRQLRLFFE